MDCVFCKIASKEIEKEFIYEDEHLMVFPDMHPTAPIHLLIVPKKHYTEFVTVDDPSVFNFVGKAIQLMIKKYALMDNGYRIVVNGGGAQDIDHLHFHLRGPVTRD